MKRKIIQLSTSTKVISLPTDWIKKNNLKKGAELEVNEKDNLIIISKENNASRKEASVNLKGLDHELIWRVLDALYVAGFEEINFQTESQEQKDTLSAASKWFPGLIIDEEKGNSVKLKSISIQEEFDLTQILSRIRNLTLTILDDAIDAIASKNWSVFLNSKKRDYTINTYVSMAMRHINKYGYSPMSRQGTISQYVKLLEIFSDRLCIVLLQIGKNRKLSERQKELLLKTRELYRQEAILVSKFNFEKLIDFDFKRQKLQNLAKTQGKNSNNELLELVQIFFEIEEVAIQLNV